MSVVDAPTGAAVPPPCAAQPERWFDPHNRHYAQAECLICPRRQWCATQALEHQATFGMWAGVFINDNLADVAGLLESVAAEGDNAEQRPERPVADRADDDPPPPATTAPAAIDITEILADRRRHTALQRITARCAGHCELMTPRCRYTFDTVLSRIPGRRGWDTESAASAYAACRPCAEAIRSAQPQFIQSLGYLVLPGYDPAYSPFYWRQHQWVFLNGGSRVLPTTRDDRTVAHGADALSPQRCTR